MRSGLLAYLWWHHLDADVDPMRYRRELKVFHAALAKAGRAGLREFVGLAGGIRPTASLGPHAGWWEDCLWSMGGSWESPSGVPRPGSVKRTQLLSVLLLPPGTTARRARAMQSLTAISPWLAFPGAGVVAASARARSRSRVLPALS